MKKFKIKSSQSYSQAEGHRIGCVSINFDHLGSSAKIFLIYKVHQCGFSALSTSL